MMFSRLSRRMRQILGHPLHQRGPTGRAASRPFRPQLQLLETRIVPSFIAAIDTQTQAIPTAIAAADFNNDGKLDVAVTNAGGHAMHVLLGKGDGTFQSPTSYDADGAPTGIVT